MSHESLGGTQDRIGILGGTFDPPHVGHLQLAGGVADALGLERVLFMPTGNPNFKQGQNVTPACMRLEMTELAIVGDPRFAIDAREVERTGVTYTVDTLLEMHAEAPEAELFFVIGADSAATLVHWRRAAELAPLATFVAVQRPGYDFERIRQAIEECPWPYKMEYLQIDTPDISSTQIRAAIAAGESVEGLVPESVAAYIVQHGIYS